MIVAFTGLLEDMKGNRRIAGFGKTCTRCGVTKDLSGYRNDKTRPDGKFPWCKDCCKADEKKRYAADPEKYKRAVALRKAADPEKVRARDRRYNAEHAEEHRARASKWAKENPERRKLIRQRWEKANTAYGILKQGRRRALLLSKQVGPVTRAGVEQRVAMFGGRCAYCGGEYEHLDHVKPIKLGGFHMLGNLRPSCRKCNQEKGAMPATEWLRLVKERSDVRSACGV